jgi:hypothetical protein
MNVINVIKLGGLIVFGSHRVAVVMAALIAASKRSPYLAKDCHQSVVFSARCFRHEN